ncbi:MAG TPA: ComEA family DNA-binding protein [Candidatus Baltobacteraceae bacterium]
MGVQRWWWIFGVAAIAAIGLWHPASRPVSGFASIATASSAIPRSARPTARAVAAVVYVVGAVVRPGLYRLRGRARIDQAVRAAGGLRSDADPAGVNLAAFAGDGDEIDVPRVGETPRGSRPRARRTPRGRQPPSVPVDPNTADAAALANVPGLGPAISARIVTYRRLNGAFQTLDELLDVAGITPAKLDRAQPYLTLDPAG